MPETNKESLDQINARVERAREELKDALEQARKAVRGVVTRVTDRGTELFNELVKTGESLQQERAKAQKTAQKKAADAESLFTSLRQRTATLLGLPTQDDIAALDKKLNSLTRKVRKIEKATGAA
ncbi:hypothetical protein A167_01969 [Alcanivorax sp. S71-1-4]|uniref:poly(hydroxyalkanoate) granule-associated protein n=1 Tax=Alcanivorax sp. S71-1-4 TaxID=1177159 RepID=UPI001358C388|nr:poly(hydroxyalkanoate) granule-associated protein [Alcanivorax sp. S71-1-4]KAF0809208.1 hypothetical protein A167_01969 [Alcanivorax sp. S71-1-4]